jgi:hypothetical protein
MYTDKPRSLHSHTLNTKTKQLLAIIIKKSHFVGIKHLCVSKVVVT